MEIVEVKRNHLSILAIYYLRTTLLIERAYKDILLLGIKASSHHIRYIAVTCSKLPLRAASCRHVSPRH